MVVSRVYGEAHNCRLLLRFRWSPVRIALSVAAHPSRGSSLLLPYYYFCLSYGPMIPISASGAPQTSDHVITGRCRSVNTRHECGFGMFLSYGLAFVSQSVCLSASSLVGRQLGLGHTTKKKNENPDWDLPPPPRWSVSLLLDSRVAHESNIRPTSRKLPAVQLSLACLSMAQ